MERPRLFFRINNYKCFSEVNLELRPLTLLFGPNGSGKSSILSGLRFFSQNIFSLYDEVLLGGPEENKYYFKPDLNTNLISFHDIAHNHNISDPIVFEIKVTNHHETSKDYKSFLTLEKGEQRKYPYKIIDTVDDINVKYDDITDEDFKKLMDKTNSMKESRIISFTVRYELSLLRDKNRLSQKVTLDDLNNQFRFSFLPNTASETTGYEYFKEINFLNNDSKNEFVQGLFDNIQMMPFAFTSSSGNMENFVENLIRNIYYKQNNTYWLNLSRVEKIQLLIELVEIADNIFNIYPSVISKYFKSLVHLPSLREKPKEVFILQENSFNKDDYYGLLKEFDDENGFRSGPPLWIQSPDIQKIYDHFNFEDPQREKVGGHTSAFWDSSIKFLRLFVFYYLDELFNLVKNIRVEKDKYGGTLYFTDYLTGKEYNLSQASSGLIQLLPIIYKSYFDREKGWLENLRLIEQPELHLHPKLQAKLAEFFTEPIFREHNFIVETHSEHLVRKIQVLIAKANKKLGHDNLMDRVAIYFFKDGKVKEMKLEENGFFKEPWPDGFFDDSYNLARELIYARKN